jgi:dihydrofolate reductase
MIVDLNAAISLDGFIARSDGTTDWVKGWDLFKKTCLEYGCVIMGRTTYQEGDSIIEGVEHIVLHRGTEGSESNVHLVNSVEQALEKASSLGFEKVLVIGGAKTNQSFAEAGLIDNLLLDIHSLALGSGVRLFGDFTGQLNLKLVSGEPIDNVLHYLYEVEKAY